jgi:hypothetical protein
MNSPKSSAALVCFLTVFVWILSAQHSQLPKVLFFANPMTSDNDVIRRPSPEVLSVAERYLSDSSKGI